MNVRVNIEGKAERLPAGTTLGRVLRRLASRSTFPPLGAIVDGRLRDHDFVLESDSDLKPVAYNDFSGFSIYRRSAALLLIEAFLNLFPRDRLVIGPSISEGYYFALSSGLSPTELDVFKVEREMKRLVEFDLPLSLLRVSPTAAEDYYRHTGFPDKAALLRAADFPRITLAGYGEFLEIRLGPFAPTSGLIGEFSLVPYRDGMVLRFPTLDELQRFPSWATRRGKLKLTRRNAKLFGAYRETRNANKNIGIETVGDLNRLISSGEAEKTVSASEEAFDQRLKDLVRELDVGNRLKAIAVCGLASSGTDRFCRRLAEDLRAAGRSCRLIRESEFHPPGYLAALSSPEPAGKRGGEKFSLFLRDLILGREVSSPAVSGKAGTVSRLPEDSILLVGLNEGLDRELYPVLRRTDTRAVFVTCFPQILIDNHNRIFSSDLRCLRWIAKGRVLSCRRPADSVLSWSVVRRYENRRILPFQDAADLVFNTALAYEPAVLKKLAGPLLEKAREDPQARLEVDRFRDFLKFVSPLDPALVPEGSVLRDFIPPGRNV